MLAEMDESSWWFAFPAEMRKEIRSHGCLLDRFLLSLTCKEELRHTPCRFITKEVWAQYGDAGLGVILDRKHKVKLVEDCIRGGNVELLRSIVNYMQAFYMKTTDTRNVDVMRIPHWDLSFIHHQEKMTIFLLGICKVPLGNSLPYYGLNCTLREDYKVPNMERVFMAVQYSCCDVLIFLKAKYYLQDEGFTRRCTYAALTTQNVAMLKWLEDKTWIDWQAVQQGLMILECVWTSDMLHWLQLSFMADSVELNTFLRIRYEMLAVIVAAKPEKQAELELFRTYLATGAQLSQATFDKCTNGGMDMNI